MSRAAAAEAALKAAQRHDSLADLHASLGSDALARLNSLIEDLKTLLYERWGTDPQSSDDKDRTLELRRHYAEDASYLDFSNPVDLDRYASYGAMAGVYEWEWSETLASTYPEYAADLRLYAVEGLTTCYLVTHAHDCRDALERIVKLRREVLPHAGLTGGPNGTVWFNWDPELYLKLLPQQACSSCPVYTGGWLDWDRLAAIGSPRQDLGEHWAWKRARGKKFYDAIAAALAAAQPANRAAAGRAAAARVAAEVWKSDSAELAAAQRAGAEAQKLVDAAQAASDRQGAENSVAMRKLQAYDAAVAADSALDPGPGHVLRHTHIVTSVAFSPDGRRVVTASATAQVWDATTGQPVGIPLHCGTACREAAFSPNGRRVVTHGDSTARVWDTETGQPVGKPLRHQHEVRTAAFSPDGGRVGTTGFNDSTAWIWDAETGQPVGTLRHGGEVHSLEFSPDGRRVVTAGNDSVARIWDAETGEPIGNPLRHPYVVWTAAFSPDGRRVATTGDWGDWRFHSGIVRIWNAETGQLVGVPLSCGTSECIRAAFSPDGRRLLTVNWNEPTKLWAVRIWDAETGQPAGGPMVYRRGPEWAAFSPDGRRVVTAGDDSLARIWDAQTGQPVGKPLRHKGVVWRAIFSPDGRRVATASSDSTACVWELKPAYLDSSGLGRNSPR